MKFALKASAALVALVCGTSVFAGTGGFSTATGGGSATPIVITNYADLLAKLTAMTSATSTTPTVITYTGNEDSLIAAAQADVCGQYGKASRTISVKRISNLTIQGADGSSANFGFNMVTASNVIIRNMTFGMMPGGLSSDGITVDSSTNVWLDHNTLFTRNYKCPAAPGDGHDGTFDGLVDIKKTADNVTVSYNYIHDHHKVGLDGYTTTDVARNVTYHHNYYDNVGARLPLQRNGLIHAYNNLYSRVGYEDVNASSTNPGTALDLANAGSGLNVRQAGKALIVNNWFENAANPVTCRYDSSNCGTWALRGNNITSPSDFTKYNIVWTDGGTGSVDATGWTSTATIADPSYMSSATAPVTAQCVKDQLKSYAGAGKGQKELVASACGTATSSSSSAASSSVASSAASSSVASSAASSSVASSKASSSAASSSVASSSSSSAASSAASTITIQESTTGFCSIDGAISTTNTGYTGTGYANLANSTGSGVDWSVNAATAGNYTVTFRYSNGGSSATTSGKLLVNGVAAVTSTTLFPKTASKTTWTTKSFTLALKAGANRIRVEVAAAAEFADIDYMSATGVTAVACQ